jgi:hypothetical protein
MLPCFYKLLYLAVQVNPYRMNVPQVLCIKDDAEATKLINNSDRLFKSTTPSEAGRAKEDPENEKELLERM